MELNNPIEKIVPHLHDVEVARFKRELEAVRASLLESVKQSYVDSGIEAADVMCNRKS